MKSIAKRSEPGGIAPPRCVMLRSTAGSPGAIAIVQLVGEVVDVLRSITAIDDWPIGRARLVRFGDIDDGIAARLSDDVAQLMPHGGPRVVQRIMSQLLEFGVSSAQESEIDPMRLYPEAADRHEALALAAITRAASPLAIDLLLDQPLRWRERKNQSISQDDRDRSRRLNHLIDPPVVVVAGPANVGKSTLSNALLGRAMSIAMDQPGTTRDYTSARIDLAGLVVDWHDTPGLRDSADPIERKAIELASRLMQRADLLIALTDPESDWPTLPRRADLRVGSKSDLVLRDDADLCISAVSGAGIAMLVQTVRDRLVLPDDLKSHGLWTFDDRLLNGR